MLVSTDLLLGPAHADSRYHSRLSSSSPAPLLPSPLHCQISTSTGHLGSTARATALQSTTSLKYPASEATAVCSARRPRFGQRRTTRSSSTVSPESRPGHHHKRLADPPLLLGSLAGDEAQGTLFYSFYGFTKIAETLNRLGFDLFTVRPPSCFTCVRLR